MFSHDEFGIPTFRSFASLRIGYSISLTALVEKKEPPHFTHPKMGRLILFRGIFLSRLIGKDHRQKMIATEYRDKNIEKNDRA
jgi:hypothetical protein